MILRARNLFLAWLTYGALQLALLGLPGAAAEPGVGARGARPQSETQSVSFGKRATLPELAHRRSRHSRRRHGFASISRLPARPTQSLPSIVRQPRAHLSHFHPHAHHLRAPEPARR
jgi:hypothetical protein